MVTISFDGLPEKYNNIPCLHIKDFSNEIHRSIPTTRYLCEIGNTVRKLQHIRINDSSRIYIPVKELYGFPFVMQGSASKEVTEVWHLNEKGDYYKCAQCSYTTEECDKRKEAEALQW